MKRILTATAALAFLAAPALAQSTDGASTSGGTTMVPPTGASGTTTGGTDAMGDAARTGNTAAPTGSGSAMGTDDTSTSSTTPSGTGTPTQGMDPAAGAALCRQTHSRTDPMLRLTASALLLAAGLAAPAVAQTTAPDDFQQGRSVSQPANGLPGVGMGIGSAGGDRGARGPGGLQNGVGAYGNMTPDASGSAGNTLTRVPGAIPEGGRSGVGIPLGGPSTNGG